MNDLFDKVRASAAALGETIAEWNRKFGAPVMDTCADVRSSSPTSGGGFVERELAVARGLAACRGDEARLDEADTELADLRQACREGWRYAAELEEERKRLAEVLPLHAVGSAYAHRLAVMLECALLDPTGTWNDGHTLLDEYRAACRAAWPDQEPPTFMGEPLVLPNVRAEPQP